MGVPQQIISGFNTAASSYGTRAQSFFTAAGITDSTQKSAVDDLFNNLHTDGLIDKTDSSGASDKIIAMYVFVGGTAATHKYNALRPTDTDADFRLGFSGGWTHDANGITGNGSNAYADTYLNENTTLTLNNTHLSMYSRTNTDGLYCDIGVNYSNDETNIFSKYGSTFYARVNYTNSGISNTGTSQRLFISNRVGSTEVRGMQDGTVKVITSTSSAKVNGTILIGALRRVALSDIAFYSPRNIAFASIGKGLTDTEMGNLTTRVTTFQTALGRNV